MRLIDDWHIVLRKAWSVRLIALAAVLLGVEVLLPVFETSIPTGGFAMLSGLITSAALVARVVAQKDIK